MSFATCIVPVAPLRKEASHRTEMVSQLLFGECVRIQNTTKDFAYIQSLYDHYEGWCQLSQLVQVSEKFAHTNHQLITAEPFTEAMINDSPMLLPAGCFIGNFKNGQLQIEQYQIQFNPNPANAAQTAVDNDLLHIIQPYQNTPYLWGGKSLFGIDCSGFTQQVFKMLDITLPRDAYQQATQGDLVNFLAEAKAGDLAFFDNEEGRITHVGLLLNSQNIMHASGKVRIDAIDNMGITNSDTGQRTHQLRIIKRFLGLSTVV